MSLISDQDIKALIEYRRIDPEDLHILESLARYPKPALFTNFNNFFNEHGENSAKVLVQRIAEIGQQLDINMHDELLREQKEMHEWYLEITRKYGWSTADNINKVLVRLQ